MAGRELSSAVWWSAGALLLVGLAVVLSVVLSARTPEGPVRVDWDGTRCARCGMLVSDPAFAAQQHLADGTVRHFDDPGCLLADRAEGAARAGAAEAGAREVAAYVHHYREDRWLRLEEAAFLPVDHSPMGFGLAAVDPGEDGAEGRELIDLEAARSRVLARVDRRRPQR